MFLYASRSGGHYGGYFHKETAEVEVPSGKDIKRSGHQRRDFMPAVWQVNILNTALKNLNTSIAWDFSIGIKTSPLRLSTISGLNFTLFTDCPAALTWIWTGPCKWYVVIWFQISTYDYVYFLCVQEFVTHRLLLQCQAGIAHQTFYPDFREQVFALLSWPIGGLIGNLWIW